MGWHHLYSRHYDKAVEQLIKTLELDPTFIIAHVFLGQSYEQMGESSSAIASFEKAVELSQRHPVYLADLGHGYAVAGRRQDALRTLDELTEISSTRYVAARGIAEIQIGLDDLDAAFAWLDKAFLQRNGWLMHIRENPRYDRLRTDPRYADLVRRMNFPRIGTGNRQNDRL
jgi:tetratricopeptide (TPR) repeat protein